MKNGIDVSQYQGNIRWNEVKADFVILRAGYGRYITQKDPNFDTNYNGCKASGIPCGAYWYSYAVTADDAKKEAEVCLSIIKGKKFEYPIYFDIEEQRQFVLGKEKCSEIAGAFLSTVENAGYFVGIYSSQYFIENYISEEVRRRYSVWVAQYDVKKPTYSGKYDMWQKSSTGRVAGISSNVDLDECYVDFPEIIKSANLNGFTQQSPQKRTLEIAALTLNGVTYSGTLTEKG